MTFSKSYNTWYQNTLASVMYGRTRPIFTTCGTSIGLGDREMQEIYRIRGEAKATNLDWLNKRVDEMRVRL